MEKDHRDIFQRMPFHQLDISEGKNDNGKEQLMDQELFNPQSSSVSSSRIIYTPTTFARTSLLHLQEVGSLQAVHPYVSKRSDLVSFLCFIVLSGEGELSYEEQTYQQSEGDCVFIDCQKAYSHSTSDNLWSLQWCHFYAPSLPAVLTTLVSGTIKFQTKHCKYSKEVEEVLEYLRTIPALLLLADWKVCYRLHGVRIVTQHLRIPEH